MEHNKEMVIVHYLKFNEVWENPLVIWSILEPGIHVRIELSLQDSFWDETTWVTLGLVLTYCYKAGLDGLDVAILWLLNLV